VEYTNNKPEPQEARNIGKPASQETKRPWVTPTFERVPLKKALSEQKESGDGIDVGTIS
jgi:hypothetical protein